MTNELRDWQREAIRKYDLRQSPDFLVCATPGAGKTVLALTLAKRLLDEKVVQRLVVVVPTDSLRRQWADEAAEFGIQLMPATVPEDYEKKGYDGCVVTYAQLAVSTGADLVRRSNRVPTVALLDEIHHAGESKAWGDGAHAALENATRRIGLTGTPWRKDKYSPIPFVTYDANGTVAVDSSYEYGEAVSDGVCRRIEFHAYDGEARWIDCGKVVSAEVGNDLRADHIPVVLSTILNPDREWMKGVLNAAVNALRELRREIPDAGGLLIADDQQQARKYADQLLQLTGEKPTLVISEEPESADRIDRFRKSNSSWLVAVRMVSEGVDIKRLAVGVYATRARTPLFFRQVVGRFVRTRPGEDVNARLFIPAVADFTTHAKEIEDELRHQLELEAERDEKATQEAAAGQQMFELRQPLSASEAQFSSSIFGGRESPAELHARAEEWCRARGIPTMFAPNVIPDLQAETVSVAQVVVTPTPKVESRAKRERLLRSEIKTLVGKVAYRTGVDAQQVNGDILRRNFPPRAKCTIEQLEQIRTLLAEKLGRP